MLYNTVSTVGLSRRMQNSLTDLQLEMLRSNDEVASGKHFDVAQALGAHTGRAIGLRNLYDETDQYLKSCTLLQGRMDTMDSALTSILDAGKDLLANAATGLGQPAPTGTSLQIGARAMLEQVIGLLNASSGNGYLFSGVEVKTVPMRPVDGDGTLTPAPMQIVKDAIAAATGGPAAPANAAQTAAVVGVLDDLFDVRDPALALPPPLTHTFEGGFYVGATAMQPGGAATPRVTGRPEDASELPYGVQANDKAVRDLLEGMYMLAAVDTSKLPLDAYTPYMQEAVDRLQSGLSGLRDTTARLGIQRAQVDETVERHNTQKKILTNQLNALEEVDPAEASVRLNQLETQIEATSAATARIARLSLTNYL